MIGQVLGHYRIEEKIGVGGMGEVFRAHDERLERDVAVKVLPAHTLDDQNVRKRFRKEALSLSSLNHPNIATVHDFDSQDGTDFLVMEYVPGTTLSEMLREGPLPLEQILDLATQLTSGLAVAHEQDLIHRDLKPSNLRITPDGRLKILDFGLAKLVQQKADDEANLTLTEAGAVLGTIPYMSPEQLQGNSVDARSDLYSAGAVLYEMATGQPRYGDTQGAALIYSILNREPDPPSQLNPEISLNVENVLMKALAWDPEQRYATARELGQDLERLQAGVTVSAPAKSRGLLRRWALALGSILTLLVILFVLNVGDLRERFFGGTTSLDTVAVLPMVNLSGDADQEYLAEGMTRELIGELTKIGALKVRPYDSVRSYRDTDKTLAEIARELRVTAVVTASVVSSGDQLHVNAQLINARDEENIWAGSFDRQLKDILSFYGEIAQTIASEVHVAVAPDESQLLVERREVDPEAYRLHLLGVRAASELTVEGIRKGIEYQLQSVEQDSTYAPPHAELAWTYFILSHSVNMRPEEAKPLMRKAAERALALNDQLGLAHAAWGQYELNFEWDFPTALRSYHRAYTLTPGDPHVVTSYAVALAMDGQYDRAIELAEISAEIDPLNPYRTGAVGWVYWWAGQLEEAVEIMERNLEANPNYFYSVAHLSWAQADLGNQAEAIERAKQAIEMVPGNQVVRLGSATVFARFGMEAEAREILAQVEALAENQYVDPFYPATVLTALGEYDRAIEKLRECVEIGSTSTSFLKDGRWLNPLRSDPRFEELVAEVFGG